MLEDAKRAALDIVSGQSGTTGVTDITDGWVAFADGNLMAYSVKVTVGGESYIVTYTNVIYENNEITSTNAIANKGTEVASKEVGEQAIVSYKVDTYVKAALTANSSIEDEEAYTVTEMSSVTTNPADSGWIQFEYKDSTLSVKDYSLTYGDVTANYSSLTDGNYVSTFGDARNKPIIIEGTVKDDGAKYLATEIDVYYNPANPGDHCDENNSDSTAGTSSGCMHWYLYSIKDGYVNMILDHDINTDAVQWASGADYVTGQQIVYEQDGVTVKGYTAGTLAPTLGLSYPEGTVFREYGSYNGTQGPMTVLNSLKELTKSWKTGTPKVPNNTSVNEQIVPASENLNLYQINYNGYHARLITISEIRYLSSVDYILGQNINNWLTSGSASFWTSSLYEYGDTDAWAVRSYDFLNTDRVCNWSGVRPVITVLASDVF